MVTQGPAESGDTDLTVRRPSETFLRSSGSGVTALSIRSPGCASCTTKSKGHRARGHALTKVVEQEFGALGPGFVVAQSLRAADGFEHPFAELLLAGSVSKAEGMHAPSN